MKFSILIFAISLASRVAIAGQGSLYKVVFQLDKNGVKTSSSSVVVQEGQKAEVRNYSSDGNGTAFDVAIVSAGGVALSVNFRLKDQLGSKSFEVAKAGVEMKLDTAEAVEIKDVDGNDIKLRMKVRKQ